MNIQKVAEAKAFVDKYGETSRSLVIISIDDAGACTMHMAYAGLNDLSFMIMAFKNLFYRVLNEPLQAISDTLKKIEKQI